jgi:hypothetical protein
MADLHARGPHTVVITSLDLDLDLDLENEQMGEDGQQQQQQQRRHEGAQGVGTVRGEAAVNPEPQRAHGVPAARPEVPQGLDGPSAGGSGARVDSAAVRGGPRHILLLASTTQPQRAGRPSRLALRVERLDAYFTGTGLGFGCAGVLGKMGTRPWAMV